MPPPPGTPLAVNAGIDKDEHKCEMASLQKIAAILHRLKKPAWVTKIDWADAYKVVYFRLNRNYMHHYKHLEVKKADRHLQVLKIGNRYFIEEKVGKLDFSHLTMAV